MSITLRSIVLIAPLIGLSSVASASPPSVVADIAPLHSLVAQVMKGVGSPQLIIPAEASPHEYNLRPSEASALQDADAVFWIGHDLTPWLEKSIETLASEATVIELLEQPETRLLAFREGALFEAHDHDGEHGDKDDHGHHDDHGDQDKHVHDAHEEHDKSGHADHHGHEHGEYDPHAWLSTSNAGAWLNLIAAKLSAIDPDNAGTYFANAETSIADLEMLDQEVAKSLEPVSEGSFLVFHDAYQYFENEYGISATGAISIGDASDPSPARIAEIQDRIRDEGIDCVLAEPQFNSGLVQTVLGEEDAKQGVIDPLGSTLSTGPDLYGQLIKGMANSIAVCLKK